jgi:hypothetical protein
MYLYLYYAIFYIFGLGLWRIYVMHINFILFYIEYYTLNSLFQKAVHQRTWPTLNSKHPFLISRTWNSLSFLICAIMPDDWGYLWASSVTLGQGRAKSVQLRLVIHINVLSFVKVYITFVLDENVLWLLAFVIWAEGSSGPSQTHFCYIRVQPS